MIPLTATFSSLDDFIFNSKLIRAKIILNVSAQKKKNFFTAKRFVTNFSDTISQNP